MNVPVKKKKYRKGRSYAKHKVSGRFGDLCVETDLDKLVDFSCGVLLKEKFEVRSGGYES